MLQGAPDRRTAPKNAELLELSATELAALVRRRALSALELVDVTIDRIERVNPPINAVVAERFDRAREEARAIDDAVRRGADLPLAGVPCTIKEFVAVRGLPQTGGIVYRRDHLAPEDAPLVDRLKAAGAIVVGTTNVPEGGLWLETVNKVYGRTNNPWDLSRTSGGSSGGEGAIVASGGVPFGLGSDIGGSIRIPSAFCGTIGHKPTGGLVPNAGMFPPLPPKASAMNCHGPLARSTRDLPLLLRVLAGPHESDGACVPMPICDPGEVSLEGAVVYVAETNGRTRVAPVMRRAVRDAARALEARGARVEEAKLPALARGLEIWGATLEGAAGEQTYESILANGSGRPAINPWVEIARAALGASPHTLPALLACLLGRAFKLLPSSAGRLVEEGRALRAELERLLSDRGVLLYPPYTRPAPRHGEALFFPLDVAHTAVFNPVGAPVTVVPVGFDVNGLPVAVQVVAAPGRDHVAIAIGRALEEDFGGWTLATPEPRA